MRKNSEFSDKFVTDLSSDRKVERKLILKQLLVIVYLIVLVCLRNEYSEEIIRYLQIIIS